MLYLSTRNSVDKVEASKAISAGIAPDGGLYVPQFFPDYQPDWFELPLMSYGQLSQDIFSLYLTEFFADEIGDIVDKSYYQKNFPAAVVPTYSLDNTEVLELWHGPTAAFKDLALQALPHLMRYSAAKTGNDKETVILVATSGDTGKAALEGFKNVAGVKIIVFYPAGGVSRIQEAQMLTTDGNNTYVVGVHGNFDDCQTAVKKIFNDKSFNQKMAAAGKEFSSANSINWGRLLPQIVYYYYGYGQMIKKEKIKPGEPINIVVPTGNFGNILAAYYALKMGLPVHRLICASNENDVLTEVINSGYYNRCRPFFKTDSPSMDILVSSNFERFIFDMFDNDAAATAQAFAKLATEGNFPVLDTVKERWQPLLWGGCARGDEAAAAIADVYRQYGYILDPHTAVGYAVEQKYRTATGDMRQTLLAATASPCKFPAAVLKALGEDISAVDEWDLPELLYKKDIYPIHAALANLKQKKLLHYRQSEKENIATVVKEILAI